MYGIEKDQIAYSPRSRELYGFISISGYPPYPLPVPCLKVELSINNLQRTTTYCKNIHTELLLSPIPVV
jgi:hypothetical protein